MIVLNHMLNMVTLALYVKVVGIHLLRVLKQFINHNLYYI
jgi:hypothetical protein